MDIEQNSVFDLVVRRTILAPPETLFRYWTDPELLMKWWGPQGVTCTAAEIDLRVGGAYRIANRLPDGAIVWIHGRYEAIERPHKLTFTWGVGLDKKASETVTVTFQPIEGGTLIAILHENVPSEPAKQGHHQGWEGCLDGLEELAAGG